MAKVKFKGDRILWGAIVLLMLLSVVFVYTSSSSLAFQNNDGNTIATLFDQFIKVAGAVVVLYVVQSIPWRMWYKYAPYLLVIAIVLLLLVKVFGVEINGAKRWLKIPIIGLPFQPSEFAKIAIIVHLSRVLSDFQIKEGFWLKGLSKWGHKEFGLVIITIVLIFLENFSTSFIISVVVFIMLILGRVSFTFLLKLFVPLGILFVLFLQIGRVYEPIGSIGRVKTINSRIDNFFKSDDSADKKLSYDKEDFQSIQAKVAIMKGGLTGEGVGNSTQRNYLPYCYSDFIFAIIVEELGLVGVLIIFFLFMILLFRSIVTANKYLVIEDKNEFGGPTLFVPLMIIGLISSLIIQALFHIGVNSGIFPVTGQTLPFISHGGTSLWISSIGIGIIIGASYRITPEGQNDPYNPGEFIERILQRFRRTEPSYRQRRQDMINSVKDDFDENFNDKNTSDGYTDRFSSEYDDDFDEN